MPRRARRTATPPIQLPGLRLFYHAFQSADLAMIVLDLDGRVTQANPAAETLLGWKPRELIGLQVERLLAPGQQAVTLSQIAADGDHWTGILEHRRKRGAVFPARIDLSLVRDQAGDALAMVAVIEDVTPLQRERTLLGSLAAAGAALNAESDLPMLLARICQEARELFAVECAYVARYDEQRDELVGVVAASPSGTFVPDFRYQRSRSDVATALAAQQRRPVIRRYEDLERAPAEVQRYGTRAALAVPLQRGERLLGVLTLTDSRDADRFSPDDERPASAYAELVAVALDGATLHEAARARRAQLLTLSRVGQLMSGTLDLERVLAAVADGARQLLGVDETRIWRLDSPDGPARLVQFLGVGEPPGQQTDIRGSTMQRVIRSGQPFQHNDIQRLSTWIHLDYIRKHDLNTCLWVPLIVRGRVLGCMALLNRAARTFSGEEVDLALTFGNQAAIAIHNAETFAQERQVNRLEQLFRRAAALATGDRQLVEGVLQAASRLAELGCPAGIEQSGARDARN